MNGLFEWLGEEISGAASWNALQSADGGAAWRAPAELLICVSAELAPKVCAGVLSAVHPRMLAVVVHRADTHSPNARILSLHALAAAPGAGPGAGQLGQPGDARGMLRLMALAPHVANLSSHMLRRPVDWSMPIAPYTPLQACESRSCLQGFSLQGALRRFKSKHGNGFTRDYGALWARLLAMRAAGSALPRVVVVGKGQRSDLRLPPELEDQVAFHPWLRYPAFWSAIYHSIALVPAFGMPVYYESRISSTVLASLVACVPLVAEERTLRVYSFLREEHVFLRKPEEDEAAAMLRIMAMPEEQIFARRRALCELRGRLNQQAARLISSYVQEAVGGA